MIIEIRRDPLQTLEGWLNEQGLSSDRSRDSVSRISSFYSLVMKPILGKDTKLGIGATRTEFEGREVYEVGLHLIEQDLIKPSILWKLPPWARKGILKEFASDVVLPLFPNPEIHWSFGSDEGTLMQFYSTKGAVYAGMLGASVRFPIRFTGRSSLR